MARTQTFLNGEVGLSIRNKLNSLAEWNGGYSYNTNDITHFNGSIYASLVDNNIGYNPTASAQWRNLTLTASLAMSASYVPNLYPQVEQVSASWASASLNAITTSYAMVAEIALNATTPISVSYASSSLYAQSASYAPFIQIEQISASWASASFNAISASFASQTISSSFSESASYAPGGGGTTLTTGSTYQITASWANTASYTITASYALNGGGSGVSSGGSYNISASYSSQSLSASIAINSFFASSSAFSTQSLFSSQSLLSTQSLFATSSITSIWSTSSLNSQTSSIATNALFASSSISSSYALSASYAPSSPSISSSFSMTASYALSSSAAGLVGQITAQVQEWTTTLSESIALYPSGNPIGVMSYVTDAQSIRIGNGETIGGVPVGIRQWIDPYTTLAHDGKASELAVIYVSDIPVEQQVEDLNTGSYAILLMNTTSSNSTSSWTSLIRIKNGNSLSQVREGNLLSQLDVSTPIISMDVGLFGLNGNYNDYCGIPGTPIGCVPMLNIRCGNGGDSINGGFGGNGGQLGGIIDIVSGAGGNGLDGGYGGNGGAANLIILSGGRGGSGINGGSGGNGGNGGNFYFNGGNGADADGITGGGGGNAGGFSSDGGNAVGEESGQNGGSIYLFASTKYRGGTIDLSANSRHGGSILSCVDGYTTPCLLAITSSLGANNTTASSNFWTSSNINGFGAISSLYGIVRNNIINANVIDHIGRSIRIKAMGTLTTDGSSSFTIAFSVGSDIFWQSPPVNISVVGTQIWNYDGLFTTRMINRWPNLTGSLIGQGILTCFSTPSSSTNYSLPNTGSLPFNTGIDNQIFLTSQWNTASIQNNIQCTNAIVELVN